MPEIVIAIIGALVSLAGGKLVLTDFVEGGLRKLFVKQGWIKPPKQLPYSEKLDKLTASITSASKEMDQLLHELTETTHQRKATVDNIEKQLSVLENREKEIKQRIDALQRVPIPVAEEFARLTHPGEMRSARRDYILFGAGVLVSTAIAILLKLVGLG